MNITDGRWNYWHLHCAMMTHTGMREEDCTPENEEAYTWNVRHQAEGTREGVLLMEVNSLAEYQKCASCGERLGVSVEQASENDLKAKRGA